MSPESATTSPWKQLYKEKSFKQHLVLIAIDEAHCIHEWSVPIPSNFHLFKLYDYNRGQDFRKAFSHIGDIRALTHAPLMSLTASAPPSVESDLLKSLHMTNPVMIKHGLDRPNTFYSVAKKAGICVSTTIDYYSIVRYIFFFRLTLLV